MPAIAAPRTPPVLAKRLKRILAQLETSISTLRHCVVEVTRSSSPKGVSATKLVRLRGVTSNSLDAPDSNILPDFEELFETLAEWERCLEGIDFAALNDVSNDNPAEETEVRS